MTNIIYHADDFGVNKEQSSYFIEAYKNGVLNMISILVNSKNIEKCYKLIKKDVDKKKIKICLHINLIEGIPLSNKKIIPHLVDEEGLFNLNFIKAIKMNFSKNKDIYKNEFKQEIKQQIIKYVKLTGEKNINIDFHQHYQVIPIIYDALIESIDELKLSINYLRIPIDPSIKVILKHPSLWFKVKPINYVKYFILKIFYNLKLKKTKYNRESPIFFCIFFSCDMQKECIKILLPEYLKYAKIENKDLELMFHPGYLSDLNDLMDHNKDRVKFITSNKRIKEKDILIDLKNN